jgi:hypothetical protein
MSCKGEEQGQRKKKEAGGKKDISPLFSHIPSQK